MKKMPDHLHLLPGIASRRSPPFSAPAILVAVLLAAASLANGAGIEDGFYRESDNASGQAVADPNRSGLRLGAKQSIKVTRAEITSQDNANTQFEVTVTTPHDGDQAGLIVVLAIGGKLYPRSGWSSSQQQDQLSFPVSGADNARDLARYFGVPITYRKHPGYKMLVSFTPSSPEFEVGQEVQVAMRIQNVGSDAFAFEQGGRNRAARDCQYTFVARLGDKQVDDIGSNWNMGGLSFTRVLKPGEVFTNSVALNKWFAFDQPGTYRVQGSYHLAFKQLNEMNEAVQFSWRPIWEDYATGEFTVKITPAQVH
jgi:hypothetical protein